MDVLMSEGHFHQRRHEHVEFPSERHARAFVKEVLKVD